MSTSVVTGTLLSRTKYGRGLKSIVQLAVGAGDYAVGGLAFDFPSVIGFINRQPTLVEVTSLAGYKYEYNVTTGKLIARKSGVASELESYAPGGGDIKGSVGADIAIASGALPVNGALLSTLADAANTTTMTIAASPDIPRNVSVSFKNTNAGASTGNAVGCVVTGTFRGAAQIETVSFSAAELTSTVQNEVATKFTAKPFSTITSVTNPVAQPANWQHAVGIGSKIGLSKDLFTPAEADVITLTKTAAYLSPSGIVDTTNMTVNFGTLADGNDVSIQWKTASAQASELPVAATPATVVSDTIRATVYTE